MVGVAHERNARKRSPATNEEAPERLSGLLWLPTSPQVRTGWRRSWQDEERNSATNASVCTTMPDDDEKRARFRGAFLGCALGDAIGRPFEMMSSRDSRL